MSSLDNFVGTPCNDNKALIGVANKMVQVEIDEIIARAAHGAVVSYAIAIVEADGTQVTCFDYHIRPTELQQALEDLQTRIKAGPTL